jgi:hypothetical protein
MAVSSATRYEIEGELLEVCNCRVLCPCWIGEDPDNGSCESALAYHFERGSIEGVDVAGLTLGVAAFIPGNVLKGQFRVILYVDDRATAEQERAIRRLWSGELGGPIADLIQLYDEVVAFVRAPITFRVAEGRGTLRIGAVVEAEMAPYIGPSGQPTTLNESIFSTIPGSPAYVSKASRFRATVPELNLDLDIQDHNAIQGFFRFVG